MPKTTRLRSASQDVATQITGNNITISADHRFGRLR